MLVPDGIYLSERALAEKSHDAIPAVDQRARGLHHESQTTIWSVRVMGIAVHIPAKARPAADVVVVDGAWGAPVHVTTFKLTSTHEDLPTLLRDLSAGLASRLSGLSVDRVVVRRADKPTRPSNYEGPKTRLLAEGALAACAKATVDDTMLADGKTLGGRCPAASKAGLEAEAALRLVDEPLDAAAAALSGLVP
jgi:hypothetical protein